LIGAEELRATKQSLEPASSELPTDQTQFAEFSAERLYSYGQRVRIHFVREKQRIRRALVTGELVLALPDARRAAQIL